MTSSHESRILVVYTKKLKGWHFMICSPWDQFSKKMAAFVLPKRCDTEPETSSGNKVVQVNLVLTRHLFPAKFNATFRWVWLCIQQVVLNLHLATGDCRYQPISAVLPATLPEMNLLVQLSLIISHFLTLLGFCTAEWVALLFWNSREATCFIQWCCRPSVPPPASKTHNYQPEEISFRSSSSSSICPTS